MEIECLCTEVYTGFKSVHQPLIRSAKSKYCVEGRVHAAAETADYTSVRHYRRYQASS